MTSSDSKRLWRRAVKEHFNCTCVYCGETYEFKELTLDHVQTSFKRWTRSYIKMWYARAGKCNADKGSSHWLGWMRKAFGLQPLRELIIHQHIIKGT